MPRIDFAVSYKIKRRIPLPGPVNHHRNKASLNANVYLLALYWKIGKTIIENQQAEGWGC